MPGALALVVIVGIAWVLTALLTPAAIVVGHRCNSVDQPGPLKNHAEPTPHLGGVAMVLGFVAAMAVALKTIDPIPWRELTGFGIGLLIAFAVGLVDDHRPLRALRKGAGQTLAAVAVVTAGLTFEVVENPFGDPITLGAWAPLITLVWIVGVMNAVNMIDGLDGLASSVAAVSSAALLGLAIWSGEPLAVVILAPMLGALLGFLPSNWSPARIFMGDTGAMFIGFSLAVAGISVANSGPPTVGPLPVVLVLLVPLLDLTTSMMRRLLSGRSPLKPDLEHLHHALVDGGLSCRATVATLAAMGAIGATFGVLAATQGEWQLLHQLEIAAIPVVIGAFVVLQVRRTRSLGKPVRPR